MSNVLKVVLSIIGGVILGWTLYIVIAIALGISALGSCWNNTEGAGCKSDQMLGNYFIQYGFYILSVLGTGFVYFVSQPKAKK